MIFKVPSSQTHSVSLVFKRITHSLDCCWSHVAKLMPPSVLYHTFQRDQSCCFLLQVVLLMVAWSPLWWPWIWKRTERSLWWLNQIPVWTCDTGFFCTPAAIKLHCHFSALGGNGSQLEAAKMLQHFWREWVKAVAGVGKFCVACLLCCCCTLIQQALLHWNKRLSIIAGFLPLSVEKCSSKHPLHV